jgi:hypothetical protein
VLRCRVEAARQILVLYFDVGWKLQGKHWFCNIEVQNQYLPCSFHPTSKYRTNICLAASTLHRSTEPIFVLQLPPYIEVQNQYLSCRFHPTSKYRTNICLAASTLHRSTEPIFALQLPPYIEVQNQYLPCSFHPTSKYRTNICLAASTLHRRTEPARQILVLYFDVGWKLQGKYWFCTSM